MKVLASEADLLRVIELHDGLVRQFLRGQIDFKQFSQEYSDFYFDYALDGHESDEEERMLLKKHRDKIANKWGHPLAGASQASKRSHGGASRRVSDLQFPSQ